MYMKSLLLYPSREESNVKYAMKKNNMLKIKIGKFLETFCSEIEILLLH